MAKVKFKFDAQAAANRVFRQFDKLKKNRKMNREIGEFLIGRIAGEARRGKPLNKSRIFPPLKASSVGIRAALKKAGFDKTHRAFRAPFSNLTISGQLIDALTFSFRGSTLQVFIDDTARKPYKFQVGKKKKAPSNAELDKELRSRGFRLFTPQGVESVPTITKRINSIVLKNLRRALKAG